MGETSSIVVAQQPESETAQPTIRRFRRELLDLVRRATLNLLTSAVTVAISACLGPPVLERQVLGYDEVTRMLDEKLLLLNIARVSNQEPVHFTSTSSIAATFNWTATLGASGEVTESKGTNFLNLNIGGSASENPTFSISPVSGKEFTERVATPFQDTIFEFLVFQGGKINQAMRLMSAGIEVQKPDGRFVRFIENDPQRPKEYEEFRQIAAHLQWLNDNRQLFVRPLVFDETLIADFKAPQAPGISTTASRSRPRRTTLRVRVARSPSSRPGFLLPVRVLSRLFRRLFLAALADTHAAGRLAFFGEIEDLRRRGAFDAHLAPLKRKNWFVYAKPPFSGPEAVLAYLGRYTHRVAISNSRLVALDERGVTFRYKDYRRNGQARYRTMTLSADEFIRRFLLHVLPKGFHRIRHYGCWPAPAARPTSRAPRS